ncbi:hypothetical protein ILYODFUR_006975 [Ilyodon furcidens]|uniref:Uncharacterized protein n=1 Tax=Ilyodon furcidens TaxID=33524 RepID=A0ABV0SYI5_9TELE
MPLTEGWKVERPLFVRNGNTPAARTVMPSQSAVQISDVHGGEVPFDRSSNRKSSLAKCTKGNDTIYELIQNMT